MNILEVVIGSNHFLIHPQTVGKKEGAPMIYGVWSAFTIEQYGITRLTNIRSNVSG